MALNYRRGSAAIEDAATKKSGGGFRPFLPQIVWKNDGESKYVLVLTDIDDVAELLIHSFIPVGRGKKANGEEFTRYEEFLSRRDPALGEDHDDLEDRLEREPKLRCMGVMVELDPVWEKGTKKLQGFSVQLDTFTRNTDDGEVEVTSPAIGFCTQSAVTLWGGINSLYKSLGDLTEIPVQITRRGKDQNTRYDIIPFMEKAVDLSPLIEFLDGVNYIGDDLEELVESVEAEEGGVAKAQVVADFLLTKRIHELADPDRYEELVGPLKLDDMPNNPYGRKAPSKNGKSPRSARPPRRSPREPVEEPTPEPTQEPSKNDRFAALRSRVEGGK